MPPTQGWKVPVLIACALLGLIARAVAAAPEGLVVEIQLAETDVLLRPGGKLPVTILVKDSSGRGVAGVALRLEASAGKLTDPKDMGQGRYQATYQMPGQRFPRAVILAAKAPGAAPGWAVLLLRAQTQLAVNTDKPNVTVTLKLGRRSYGPFQTDDQGRVAAPVEVRPGQSEAQAIAVDEYGNTTVRRVVIPVPASCRMVGFAERERLVADGADGSDLYLVVIQPDGSPAPAARFLAAPLIGALSPGEVVRPGLFRMRFTAPAARQADEIRLGLAEELEPKLNFKEFVFSLAAPPPAPAEVPTARPEPAPPPRDPSPPPAPPPAAPVPPPRLKPHWFALGPWAGFMTSFGRIQSAALSLELIGKLPLGDALHLSVEAGYRFGTYTGPTTITDLALTTRVEVLPLHLSLMILLLPNSAFTPYLGAGGGLEFVQWSLGVKGGDPVRDHTVLWGALGYLGGELRVGPGAAFVQVRYLYAYLQDRAGPGGSLIKGNVGGLEIGLGYRLFL